MTAPPATQTVIEYLTEEQIDAKVDELETRFPRIAKVHIIDEAPRKAPPGVGRRAAYAIVRPPRSSEQEAAADGALDSEGVKGAKRGAAYNLAMRCTIYVPCVTWDAFYEEFSSSLGRLLEEATKLGGASKKTA